MICHKCESEDVTLTVMNSPIIIDQVEALAVCQDCGAEYEHSIAGGDFELIEPDEPENTQQGRDLFGDDGWSPFPAAEETYETRQ